MATLPELIFDTDRLQLRSTNLDDADFTLRLLNSPKWIEYIGDRNVHTVEEAKQYILDRVVPQQERLGYASFTVIRKSDGVKMGSCGLYDREGLEGVDLGFAFLPEYEGQGYAFESASKILDVSSAKFGIKKLQAITLEVNLSSRSLLEKLGFTFKEKINLPNDPEELMLYKLEL